MHSSFFNSAFNKRIVTVKMNNFRLLSLLLVMEPVMLVVSWNRAEFSRKIKKGLKEVRATCGRLDNCRLERESDSLDYYNCHCDRFCNELNTCCYDSSYITKQTQSTRLNEKPYNFKCMRVDGYRERYFYMVDSCNAAKTRNKILYENCKNNAEEANDFNLAIPVTSKRTGITYKNRYCASCNDDANENDLVLWKVLLKGSDGKVLSIEEPNIHYNHSLQTWTGIKGADQFNVSLGAFVPQEVENIAHTCIAYVISSCADNWMGWPLIKRFCDIYTALSKFNERIYRNPHCAMCNFEDFRYMECRKPSLRTEADTSF